MKHPIIAGVLAAALIIGAAVFMGSAALAAECRGQVVVASYYGTESGKRTANGEPFNGTSITAAHKTLPFGTKIRVTYRGKSVVVRINDRGPYVRGRTIDLSKAAAAKIGMVPAGVAKVCMERLK